MFTEIKINGMKVYRPNNFTPTRENVYSGEYTACTGATYADYLGWKYSDMTLSWDALPYAQRQFLLTLTGQAELTFRDADGLERTEQVIVTNLTQTATRLHDALGFDLWTGIELGVRFIGIHQ
jgi:hypothetical protein